VRAGSRVSLEDLGVDGPPAGQGRVAEPLPAEDDIVERPRNAQERGQGPVAGLATVPDRDAAPPPVACEAWARIDARLATMCLRTSMRWVMSARAVKARSNDVGSNSAGNR
jgi:hypothetical protein